MQISNLKYQNEKSKFKEQFVERLIRFSLAVLSFTEGLRNKRALWSIADQLIRCATSIGANVFEAKSSSSRRDYIRYFEIALKSANETKYWLILIGKSHSDFIEESRKLYKEVDEISKIIGSSVLTLKGKK